MVVDGTTTMAGGANLHGTARYHGDGAPSPLPRNLPPSANRGPATMTRQRRRKPRRAVHLVVSHALPGAPSPTRLLRGGDGGLCAGMVGSSSPPTYASTCVAVFHRRPMSSICFLCFP
ncbi:hypothetical protein VPH35_019686 [Triticum aestivum]